MTSDNEAPRNTVTLATAPAPPQPSPAQQKAITLALLRVRPGCCPVCDALVPLSEALFRQLAESDPQAVTQAMDAQGNRYEVAPLAQPDWLSSPPAAPAPAPPAPSLTH